MTEVMAEVTEGKLGAVATPSMTALDRTMVFLQTNSLTSLRPFEPATLYK